MPKRFLDFFGADGNCPFPSVCLRLDDILRERPPSGVPQGHCILCLELAELRESHILPAFAFRWLRDSSGTGHIRNTSQVNVRVQDGVKRYWMCSKCEGRLGEFERRFAGELFRPYLHNTRTLYPYGGWLNRFCASLSWRVLRFHRDENHLSSWDPQALGYVTQALETWADLLRGNRSNPGVHEQHLLPLDEIESTTIGGLPRNINRYLMRVVDMDVLKSRDSICTYAKLGRFVIIGFVHEPNPRHWQGSKVHANEGIVEPKHYRLPRPLWDYIDQRARRTLALMEGISEPQRAKVEDSFRQNTDRYLGSDAYLADLADFELHGDDMFSSRE